MRPHEPLHVDHETLVRALTDTLVFVVGLDPEHQPPPITLGEGRSEGDAHADRGGRQVTDVDVGSHGALARAKCSHGELVGGELEVADEHGGRQHLHAAVAEPIGRH
jgi:hypothetical protein